MCVRRELHNTDNTVLPFSSVALIGLSQTCFTPERIFRAISFYFCGNLHLQHIFYEQYLNIVRQAAVIINALTFNETSKYVNISSIVFTNLGLHDCNIPTMAWFNFFFFF